MTYVIIQIFNPYHKSQAIFIQSYLDYVLLSDFKLVISN